MARIVLSLISIIILNGFLYASVEDSLGSSTPLRLTETQLKVKESEPEAGISFNYGPSIHSAKFIKLGNVPMCCPKFNGGTGGALSIGINYHYPFDSLLSLNAGLNYNYISGELTQQEAINLVIDGKSEKGKFEYILASKLHLISLTPSVGYNLFKNFTVYAGLNLGFLLGSHYDYVENLTEPANRGTFNNGKRTRNESDSIIPYTKSFHTGLNIGLGYSLPLDKKNKWHLEPQVIYTYDFMPVSSGLSWHIHTLRFGLELKRSMVYEVPPPPVPPLPPPEPKEPQQPVIEKPSVDITVIQLDSNNVEKKKLDLKIEDYVTLNLRPLLNYIFFDENSAEIPDKYIKLTSGEANEFNINSLHHLDALGTYYQLLNLVGKKLRDNPEIKIKLTGTNSDEGDEYHNKNLSRQRAEAVGDYLMQVWDIPKKQIIIKARNLPDDYSNPKEPGGIQENRRVEIVPSDNSILEPLLTLDTISLPEKTKFRFYPKATLPEGISKWSLNIESRGNPVKIINGKASLPNYIDWSPVKEDIQKFAKSSELTFTLNVEDSLGNAAQSVQMKIPVEKITLEKKKKEGLTGKDIDYYSLILFDFGKTNLLKEHLKMLNYIKQQIKPGSKVIITGYTDNIGDVEVNKKISVQRAKQAAKTLDIPDAVIVGSGESNLLYDNSLPEGRFYCRTVNITVETPVENK